MVIFVDWHRLCRLLVASLASRAAFLAIRAIPQPEITSMALPTPPSVSAEDLIRTLRERPRRWLLPAALVALAALVFAIVRPRTWEATQALVVRDEVSIDGKRELNSTRADDTKAAQETILELAHSQSVLKQALEIVGPDKSSSASFPTARDVEDLGDVIKLVPPKGGEFGKTDIFYLKSQDRSRERALALAGAVSERVQSSFEELRKTKAKSIIRELEKTVGMARQDLEVTTRQLADMERQIGGSDLGELRIMNELPSGMSDLRNESFSIETELRKEFNEKLQSQQLLVVLKAAEVDPGELLACPNGLLKSQPGLKRLKDGLIDAQIKGATLLGSMAPDHPQVQAAREVAEQIGVGLHSELPLAVRAIEADLRLTDGRIASLERQKAQLRARFDKLADIRARYGNLAAMAKNRGEILKGAEIELAEARSKQAAAQGGAMLQLIGEPVTGTRPMGPGRAAIVLGGILGGLILGVGIVVLTAKPQTVNEETQARILTIPQPRSEFPRPAVPSFEPGEQLPPLKTEYFVSPAPVRDTPFAPAGTPSRTETPPGPLTFRQALERIAAVQGRL